MASVEFQAIRSPEIIVINQRIIVLTDLFFGIAGGLADVQVSDVEVVQRTEVQNGHNRERD